MLVSHAKGCHPVGLHLGQLGGDPLALLAEHGGAAGLVGLLARDQVEDGVHLGGTGDGDGGVHASSSFSRPAAGTLPGSARSAAIRQVSSRSRSLTGVGTPTRRPSIETSPLR